jgi:hypothetical protein
MAIRCASQLRIGSSHLGQSFQSLQTVFVDTPGTITRMLEIVNMKVMADVHSSCAESVLTERCLETLHFGMAQYIVDSLTSLTTWQETPLGKETLLGKKHHLARHSTGIFAHYTVNLVITTLFSTAYEG